MRFALLIVTLLMPSALPGAEPLRVAVAANFRHTLEQINARFEAGTGQHILLSSASTGVLYSQILHGAPFDLFFAADRATPLRLAAEIGGSTFCYASGQLVLIGDNGELGLLANPGLSLAIANPVTAPYGAAAMDVLARPEFASGGERKLVRGNNVAQAFQFWRSGGTDLALVARALAPEGTPVPEKWHRPLEQHAVVLPRGAASDAAEAYLSWIRSDTVRSQIIEAGYAPCP
jgi:molybdate transport system substrate-binding protein